MNITVNHIASEIREWCKSDAHILKSYFDNKVSFENIIANDLKNFFNSQEKFNCVEKQNVYETDEHVDLLFNPNADHPTKKILAELICESSANTSQYKQYINNKIAKLTNTNIKDEYNGATKCMISLYFNLTTRNFLHDKDFIEIFNNMEIGCAMKRLK